MFLQMFFCWPKPAARRSDHLHRWSCWQEQVFYLFFRYFVFLALIALLIEQLEDLTGNRTRERRSDTQQRAPGRDSNPGRCSEDTASVHGTPVSLLRVLQFILEFILWDGDLKCAALRLLGSELSVVLSRIWRSVVCLHWSASSRRCHSRWPLFGSVHVSWFWSCRLQSDVNVQCVSAPTQQAFKSTETSEHDACVRV